MYVASASCSSFQLWFHVEDYRHSARDTSIIYIDEAKAFRHFFFTYGDLIPLYKNDDCQTLCRVAYVALENNTRVETQKSYGYLMWV